MTQARITKFDGEFSFLSNFHPAPMTWDGLWYPTSEHAYQSAKTLDMELRKVVSLLPRPADAKKFGGKRSGKIVPREDWERVKVAIMYDIVTEKFKQNADLRKKLMLTEGSYLEEGNVWNDTFWGVCRGKGKNILGEILMTVRNDLVFFAE